MTIIDSILNGQFLELFTSLYTMLTRFLLSKTCFIFKLICSDIRAIKTVWFGYLFGIIYLFGSSSWLDTISPKLLIMFDPHLGWCNSEIFKIATNIFLPYPGSNPIPFSISDNAPTNWATPPTREQRFSSFRFFKDWFTMMRWVNKDKHQKKLSLSLKSTYKFS